MSLETSAAKLCYAMGCGLNSAAPKRIKSSVSTHAFWGGLVMAIPLWGVEVIAYALILWNMYASVARIAGLKFGASLITNVIGGFIINLICMFVLNIFLDFIFFLGWIGMFIAGYFGTRYSGIAYLGILQTFHGKSKMKETLDLEKGKQAFLEAGGKKASGGVARSAIVDELLN